MTAEEHITEQILEWMRSNDDLRSFVSRMIDAAVDWAVKEEMEKEREACLKCFSDCPFASVAREMILRGDHRKPKKPRYGVEPQFHVVDAIHEGIVKTFGTIEAAQAECNRLNGGK